MAAIKRNLVFLSENITNLPKILLYLFQEDVISKDDRERIKSKETSLERNEELLLYLMTSDWEKNQSIFLKILRETNNEHCVDKIEHESVKIGANEIGQLLLAAKEISEQIWFGFTAPNMIYVGREKETELLQKYWSNCMTKKTLSFVSVTGLGGVGKSELATNFAKWFYETVQGHCIWIAAEGDQSFMSSFNNLAEDLQISLSDTLGKEKEFLKIVEEVYEKLFGEKLLFVFDNLENYGHEALKLLNRLSSKKPPNVLKPFVITTSRLVEAKKYFGTQCHQMDLQVLSKPSAMEFFNTSLSLNGHELADGSHSQPEAADGGINELIVKLCKRLQCYPLAMQQASAYIHERMLYCGTVHEAVTNYLTEIEIQTKALLNYKLSQYEALDDISKTTFLTWRITIAKLRESKEGGVMALNIINAICCLSPDNIPTQMVKSILQKIGMVSNTDNIDNLCELIRRYSMINFVGEKLISVHRLVQEVTRIELGERGFSSLLNEIAICMVAMMEKKPVSLKELVHVQVIWQHVSKSKKMMEDHGRLPTLICADLWRSGKYKDMMNFSSESENLMESVLGQNNKWSLQIKWMKGVALRELSDYLKSLDLLKNVYKIQKKNFGEKDDDFLNTAYELGNTYFLLKRHDEAMNIFKYTLDRREQFYGMDHQHAIEIRRCFALLPMGQNRSVDFQKLHEELLELEKLSVGAEDPIILADNYNMKAQAKFIQKDYQGALKEYKEALKIQEGGLDIDHPFTLTTKLSIAMAYARLGRYEESLLLLKEVQEKVGQLSGPRYPTVIQVEKMKEGVRNLARISDGKLN